jgi:hypothetical protein
MSVTGDAGAWARTRETPPWATEDWLSVGIGLFIFLLALGALSGLDLLGWAVTTTIWIDPGRALGTLSPVFAPLGGAGASFLTYAALLVFLSTAAVALKLDIRRGIAAIVEAYLIYWAVVYFIARKCFRAPG